MPLDTSIARSVKPLKIQFRDLGADYNQLAQMQAAENQNQLAQMQMQEARQLAPLRMQEQQSRAAAAKLTLDDANEAQTYIKTVMAKAAEASNGTATKDPFDAAKQMMEHPNSQVQAAGLRLLESFQKLQTYEQQSRFMKDEDGAPAAAASGSVNNVVAPMIVPSVMQGGYSYQKDVANALAPAVAAAPAVNAMIPAVASALQNADALKKEIEKGDRTYGKASGWTSKRELLVEAYKQALKPGAVGTKSEFERLLDESDLSDTEKQDMRKAKLAKETAKTSDRPEAKSDFEKLLAESGLTEDQKQEMRKAKLAKETAKPAEKKTDFEQLLEDSGLSETEKQDMRKAKLAKETAKPADKVEAKSDFEKLLADSGLTEDQKQAARQAKITKETAAPVSQAERKTDFEKLLEDSGLSETEKQDMRKAKLAKETSTSAAADSQFERTMTALGLSDAKKNALRSQLLAKEVRIPTEGGAAKDDPKTTAAFREVDAAGNVTFYNKFGNPISTQKGAGKPSATFEKTTAQRKQLSSDLTTAIAELTEVTKDGGLIDQSTGSGAGRLVDIAARFGGKAMPGDIAIGKLQPIADLVLKMIPRFEGPQSNADTTSYKQAAAQLADPTLPAAIRKEAGKTVMRLMKKRKDQFVTQNMADEGTVPGGAAPAANVDALLDKYK